MLGQELHNMRRKVLGLSIDSVAALSGINMRRLVPYFGGVSGLPNGELEKIENLLNNLTKLAEHASPFVLPRGTQALADLLERMRAGEFDNKRQHVSL